MSIYGSVPVFDYKSDEWPVHVAQLKNFFTANGIDDQSDAGGVRRRAILLNCMSQDSYRLTRDLLFPVTPESAAYTVILETLNAHFQPKKCIYAERQKFYAANKDKHESLSEYAARLRGLASECDFGSSLEMCMTDRFVLGVDSSVVRERLFREKPNELKLVKALELASSVESAQRVVCADVATTVKTESVFYAGTSAGPRRPRQAPGAGGGGGDYVQGGRASGAAPPRCAVCGAKSHTSSDCAFRHLSCDICGVKGHLKRVCPSKSVNNKSNKVKRGQWQNHYICENSDSDELYDCEPINNIRCLDEKPILVEVRAGGVALTMEVDSGSAVSALPMSVWRMYFSQNSALGESHKTLRTYDGSLLSPVGVCELPVTYNDVTQNIIFYVVENARISLLGRDFLAKFNLAFVPLNFCSENKQTDESVLEKYECLFSGKLGTFNKYKLSLHLKEGVTPKFFKARSVPFAIKDKVEAELDRLVRAGIIKPVTYSNYASPIVAVLKKNNDVRICGDYSVSINKDLKVDSYPLPKISELCSSLHDCRYFTKIDLSNSYNQFLLDDKSQEYTCINTHKGLFVYTRLAFGLANAPALFQRAMVQLLQGIEGVECFLDDVLIAAPTPELHWQRVDHVLSRLRDAGLMLQKSKCSFFQKEIEYLGYIIDHNGLHKNPDKVKAISEVKVPENTKQLKSFLGIVNFYHGFIPQAAALLEPLHALLRKDAKWVWTSDHQKSFDAVKEELSSPRVLAHYDPRQQLVLTVDAAPGGLGAVLAVRYKNGAERPISYASRALSKSERAYSQIHKEATAIIYGIKKYHQYLYGRQQPFILRTDHKPLLSIFSPDKGIPQMTESKLQRYALILAAYNYKIEFISGEKNVADYLSRFPVEAEPVCDSGSAYVTSYVNALAAAGAPLPGSLHEMQAATAADETLSRVVQYVAKGWPRKVRVELLPYSKCRHELHVDNGCLMRGHRIIVPPVYRQAVLQELHAAHLGIVKMKSLARERCWYPGIDGDIENITANCDRCIFARPSPAKASMEAWQWPTTVFERIHLDFLGPLHGKTYLVLVDAHSKWIDCVEVSNLSTQVLINKLKDIFSHFGLPNTIVSDNAKTFVSTEFGKFCSENGIAHIFSPPYTPQSNGLAENAVKTSKRFLINALLDVPAKDVGIRLQEYLSYYRNTPHCTTGVSPSSLMFGRNMRCKLDLINAGQKVSQVHNEVQDRVRLSQSRQKDFFGGKNRFFSKNDRVWMKDYRTNPKKPVWSLGLVKKRVGKVIYEVILPGTDIVWRRHVNQLLNANSYIEKGSDYLRTVWPSDFCQGDTGGYSNLPQSADSSALPAAASAAGAGASEPASPAPQSPARDFPCATPPAPAAAADADHFVTPPSDISAPRVFPSEPIRTRSGRIVVPPQRLNL